MYMDTQKKIAPGDVPSVIKEAKQWAKRGHWGNFGSGMDRLVGYLIFIGLMAVGFIVTHLLI